VDAGNGSAVPTRAASARYDMGFCRHRADGVSRQQPDALNKPVAVMVVYNNTPASVMTLKVRHQNPADL
jgi:NitT/TauT family transport system substrate-binding protein